MGVQSEPDGQISVNKYDGALGYVQGIYNRTIRDSLPMVVCDLSGVKARQARLFDLNKDRPDYKKGLVEAIYEHVEQGMTVEEIGTGRGILTVHCLRAGAEQVSGYDASKDVLELAQETLQRNIGVDWSARVSLHHAVVQSPGMVRGASSRTIVPASRLSSADVLLMDAEGAEEHILQGLGTVPDVAIVETHPERGVPAGETKELLEELEYRITEKEYEPGVNRSVKPVLVGTR